MQAALAALYGRADTGRADTGRTQGSPLQNAGHQDIGRETLDVLATLEALDPSAYRPSGDARYPETDFGMGLRQVAMLIKAEAGLEVACLDLGGWDTHIAQGGSEGLLAGLLAELAGGLAALLADLRDHADRLLVVAMSEFGRRVQENGGLGTDHGHGGAMLLLGGGVAGGQGAWALARPGARAAGRSRRPGGDHRLPQHPWARSCSGGYTTPPGRGLSRLYADV